MPVVISFEFNFRVSSLGGDIPEGRGTFRLPGRVPDPKTQTYQVAEIAFAPDGLKGTENLLFNHAVWEIQGSETFLGRWHRARVAYDMTGYTGSVWIDGEPVLVGVPLQPDLNVQDRPEISLTRSASLPIALWIDDVEVGFQDISLFGKDQKEVEPQRLFRDNFNGYESAFFPLQGGWISGGDEAQQAEKLKAESTVEGAKASKAAETGERPANSEVDDQVYASSAKSFRLEAIVRRAGKGSQAVLYSRENPLLYERRAVRHRRGGTTRAEDGRGSSILWGWRGGFEASETLGRQERPAGRSVRSTGRTPEAHAPLLPPFGGRPGQAEKAPKRCPAFPRPARSMSMLSTGGFSPNTTSSGNSSGSTSISAASSWPSTGITNPGSSTTPQTRSTQRES